MTGSSVAPVTASAAELYSSVDIDALSNLLAKQALDTVVANGFDAARRKLQNTCVDALRGCRGAFGTGGGGAMGGPMAAGPPGAYGHAQQMAQQPPPIPDALQLLPLYTMALQKMVVFRGGTDVRADDRAAVFQKLTIMGVSESRYLIYPRMFAIHEVGVRGERALGRELGGSARIAKAGRIAHAHKTRRRARLAISVAPRAHTRSRFPLLTVSRRSSRATRACQASRRTTTSRAPRRARRCSAPPSGGSRCPSRRT